MARHRLLRQSSQANLGRLFELGARSDAAPWREQGGWHVAAVGGAVDGRNQSHSSIDGGSGPKVLKLYCAHHHSVNLRQQSRRREEFTSATLTMPLEFEANLAGKSDLERAIVLEFSIGASERNDKPSSWSAGVRLGDNVLKLTPGFDGAQSRGKGRDKRGALLVDGEGGFGPVDIGVVPDNFDDSWAAVDVEDNQSGPIAGLHRLRLIVLESGIVGVSLRVNNYQETKAQSESAQSLLDQMSDSGDWTWDGWFRSSGLVQQGSTDDSRPMYQRGALLCLQRAQRSYLRALRRCVPFCSAVYRRPGCARVAMGADSLAGASDADSNVRLVDKDPVPVHGTVHLHNDGLAVRSKWILPLQLVATAQPEELSGSWDPSGLISFDTSHSTSSLLVSNPTQAFGQHSQRFYSKRRRNVVP